MTKFEEAKAAYNELMFNLGIEFATIGTDYSEGTDNWNVRDMVSECQYHLDCCYEEDNANADGRVIKQYMDDYGASYKEAEDAHMAWLHKTRALRSFITKYKKQALMEKATQGHCSKFD